MLPGVELARKRRFYHHREPQTTGPPPEQKASSSATYRRPHPPELSSMSEEAALALIRLEEKLRGLPRRSSGPRSVPPVPVPSSSSSAASSTSSGRSRFRIAAGEKAPLTVATRPPPPPPPPEDSISGHVVSGDGCNDKQRGGAGEEGNGGGAGKEVCAVCLDEVAEGKQRVTQLPCSHKYHSGCVLPWLAAHPHCPCCRAPCSNNGIIII